MTCSAGITKQIIEDYNKWEKKNGGFLKILWNDIIEEKTILWRKNDRHQLQRTNGKR